MYTMLLCVLLMGKNPDPQKKKTQKNPKKPKETQKNPEKPGKTHKFYSKKVPAGRPKNLA